MDSRVGNIDGNIRFDIDEGVGGEGEGGEEGERQDKREVIMGILGKIEKAINTKEKDKQGMAKDGNGKEIYGRSMLKRLFSFLVREIHKQKENILNKECDFDMFLEHWILNRYGLDEICH